MLWNKLIGAKTRSKIGVNFLQTAVNTSNLSTYTFSSQNLGTAFSGRLIVVGIAKEGGTGNVSSVTVGGETATRINISTNNNNSALAELWIAQVNTGTTGNVVVSFSSGAQNCGIALWALSNASGYNVEAIPDDASSNTSDDNASQTINFASVINGDVILVMVRIRSANVGTYSVTGATQRFDQVVESGRSGMFGADAEITQNELSYDVVVSSSGTNPVKQVTVTRFFIP